MRLLIDCSVFFKLSFFSNLSSFFFKSIFLNLVYDLQNYIVNAIDECSIDTFNVLEK